MSAFFDAFNASLESAAREFGETWSRAGDVVGVSWPAIAIETMEASTEATPGGKRGLGKTSVLISRQTELDTGVKEGDIIIVRGVRVRVGPVRRDGDASCWLDCVSAGVGPVSRL